MSTPKLNKKIDSAKAEAAGMPVVDGKQAIATARRHTPRGVGVTWYHLEDGTETVRDDAGNEADWPA